MKRVIWIWLLLGCVGVGWRADASALLPDRNQPLRLRHSILPVFPHALLMEGIVEGWARIVIDVDAAGFPTDWLVVGYTRSEFGDAAVNAVRQWKFDPMIIEGQAMASQVAVAFDYQAKGVVLSITSATDVMQLWFPGMRGKVYRPSTLPELDGIPVPQVWVEPIYPLEYEKRGVSGSATVEFYIDETGAVRMPAIAKTDFPELGHLLAYAIRQWKFEPPTVNGRPVLVHASQTVVFGKPE